MNSDYENLVEKCAQMTAAEKRERITQIDQIRAEISLKIKALQFEMNALGDEADYLSKELGGQKSLLPFATFSEAVRDYAAGF